MEFYRLETDINEINSIIDTNNRNNCKRAPYLKENHVVEYLKSIIDQSILNNITLFEIFNREILSKGFQIVDIIPGIWEVLYDMARPSQININRLECSYFFSSIEDCKKHKQYPGMVNGVICKVQIIEQQQIFIGDMNWLNNIDECKAKAIDALDVARKYWEGKKTQSPMLEILFQGKYKLIPIEKGE